MPKTSAPEPTLSPENPEQVQNLTLLKIYTFYRVLLSIGLLLTFSLTADQFLIGSMRPQLFVFVVTLYLIINSLGLIIVVPKITPFNARQLFASFFYDIVTIVLIADTSGGVNSGMGMLLVIVIAASSILLRGQLATLTAAIATIIMIGDTARLTGNGQLDHSSFLAAGLLGLTLFITTFFIQMLTQRIRGAQQVASQRAIDVSKLQLLNRQIIQSMRTGILVTNNMGYLQMANAAAAELLDTPELEETYRQGGIHRLPAALMQQLEQWVQAPQFHTAPFRATTTGPEIQASFSSLNELNSGAILIFLEDNRLSGQRAQQIKLASLGRLTASIAHEIRNPLSAISHAAQLLNESEALDKADQRLSQIIQNHSLRMDKVIENVLQLSRRQAPHPEKLLLNSWLQSFIDDFEFEESSNFAISLNTHNQDHQITADASQLAQVVANLAQNGLRYSLQHTGVASLTLDVHINPSSQLPVLDIIDQGAGVDDSAVEKLFEPFYTTEQKGTGLGLYISRELCEANEARIDYVRSDSGDSCFRISFPHPDRQLSPRK